MEIDGRQQNWSLEIIGSQEYIEGCDMCQRMKNRMEEVAGNLKLSEVLEKPWTHLMVDFITKLLIVARKDAILVVYDRLSKIVHFVATTERTSADIMTLS